MHVLQVRSTAIGELQTAVIEAEQLSSRPLNKEEQRRFQFLLAKIGLLKAGLSPSEIANAEAERLAKEAGWSHIPVPASDEVEREWRDLVNGKGRVVMAPVRHEVRAAEAGAQSISTSAGSAGGYFVPIDFHARTTDSMKQYDQIFDEAYCNVLASSTGHPTTLPLFDDIAAESVQVDENTKGAAQDFTASSVQLEAYSFRSGIVYCSVELLQDSGIPLGALLEGAFARRHARGVGKKMINGSGVNTPTGLVTAVLASGAVPVVAAGANANTGNVGDTGANSIGSDDLAALWQALNPSYRRRAIFALNDSTYVKLMSLNDKSGRPLIQIQHDVPTIYGRPVAICPSMDTIGASKNTIVFYDPTYFYQRRIAAGSYVRRFLQNPGAVERGLVGFESWYRTDSNLAVPNAQFPPAALLQQHS
jgi:HK97 family phage major capsid protein